MSLANGNKFLVFVYNGIADFDSAFSLTQQKALMDKQTELLENLLVSQVLSLAHQIQSTKVAAGYNPKIESCVAEALVLMDASRSYILQKLLASR